MTVLKADTARRGNRNAARGNGGSNMQTWREMAEKAVESGRMGSEAMPAAMSMAGQIVRLESRFEQYYRLGEEDPEVKKVQSSPEALDRMGKCEKQLAELKQRFFELAGLDRQYAAKTRLMELQADGAEQGGEVVLKLEGFGELSESKE